MTSRQMARSAKKCDKNQDIQKEKLKKVSYSYGFPFANFYKS